MENVVLAFMAHPDDAEFLCGGTLALLGDQGWQVHVATMTPGDCGSATLGPEEIARVRRGEAKAAAKVIGGTYHCLERRDLCVCYNEETLALACGLLRKVRPRLIITHSPSDYMVDHEQASLVARASAFNAPIPNAPASPGGKPCDAIPYLYYADPVEGKDVFGEKVQPSLLIDIGEVIETKLEMLVQHASQREWLRRHHGMDEYLEGAKRLARERGRAAGCEYAEGFRQHKGHAYPQDDLLAFALPRQSVLHLRIAKRKRRTT